MGCSGLRRVNEIHTQLIRSEFGDFPSPTSEIALVMRLRWQNRSPSSHIYQGSTEELRRSWKVSYVASKSCFFLKKNTKLHGGSFCEFFLFELAPIDIEVGQQVCIVVSIGGGRGGRCTFEVCPMILA